MNVNYNNLYCDYIGATGGYSISDYIDITSNTLATNSSNFTLGTSNILNNKINITSNTLDTKIYNVDYKYNNLIRSETENDLINTYIYNSNVGGEIRFYVKNSGIFDINNASGQPYRVKIGTDGKLYLYYNYNVAIGLLETERWVEPINMLIGHNVALGNLNAITGATDITVGALIIKVKNIEAIVYEANIIRNDAVFYNPNSTYDQLLLAYNKIKASFTYANSIYAGIVGSLGFGITFAIYGFIQGEVNRQFIENNLQYQLNYNSNLTNTEKSNLISQSFNVYSSNLNDMNTNLSNLNILNGFINSNITTEQLIPNLKCNSITLNNKSINKFSLDNLDDWVKTTNGIYYDITNGTLAINSTPTTTDFFRVGGQTTIQGDIIGETKIKINNINQGFPSVGINGGNGDRLILKEGTVSTYPVSFGFSGLDLWYSVPTAVSHRFYVNGSLISSIFSAGLSTTGYINASTNLRENGVNLSSKYLLLSGGNMTGQITGVTTLNGTTGIFGTLQTTNNINQGFPSVGINGGNGDRLILYSGSVSTYPYSFGINTNELWYSTPSGASHKFYNNGTNILTLNSTGDITISGSINITSGNQFLTFGQRLQDNLIKLWTDGINTFGIGINSSVLRYNVPTGSSHIFYVNVSPITTITSTGLSTTGTINASTNLQENGVNLSSKYLQLSGGTMTGDLNITTATKVLNFGSRTEDYLIRLFGTDYGFGINGGVLRYNSAANHVFYCAGTERMRLTTDGNLSTTGYIYAGGTTNGLRINGNDYGNTIYQNATTIGGQPANIGFTLRDANSFNFQSFSSAGLYTTIARFNTTNGLSLFGNMTGGYNVCKRSIFTFTPTGVIIGGFGFRYAQDIQLTNYISTLTGPIGNMYIFRIHIWTTSGDFGDSSANVENMTYLVYLADFGGNPKIRIHTIVNNSNGSLIAVQSSTSIYYNGWNGAGGASQKYCVIENISGY